MLSVKGAFANFCPVILTDKISCAMTGGVFFFFASAQILGTVSKSKRFSATRDVDTANRAVGMEGTLCGRTGELTLGKQVCRA
jgi:hypothetical protein